MANCYKKWNVLFIDDKIISTLSKFLSYDDMNKLYSIVEEYSKKMNDNQFISLINNFPNLIKKYINNSIVNIKSIKYDVIEDKILYELEDGFIYTKEDLQKKVIYAINIDKVIMDLKQILNVK